ncbi:MAG: formylglycine-generating enzyme family protein [Treponema sp.]|nr:formylglycine-generating enzyme family protein [Treponema sp.]
MYNSAVASASYTISSGNIPEGFVKVKGTTITGNESWTPWSHVFVSRRSITIPDMYVCDHEVTRGEFKELMGTDPSIASAYDKDGNELTGDAVLNNPVNYVNWYATIAYCNKLSLKENLTPCYSVSGVTDWENLAYSSIPTSRNSTWDALTYNKEADGYRLPTDAEWEWLARGGENYTYAGSDTADDVAWYETNTNGTGTREVKTKQANGYGLYDMSGNVDEWCYDWYGAVNSSTADTGKSSGSSRVQRGGSWGYSASLCAVSLRISNYPNYRLSYYGFRVVRSSSK